MFHSKVGQKILGLFLLVVGGFLMWDVWTSALTGKGFEPDQGVYSPLFIIAGLVLLFGRLDLAARKAAYEGNQRWFWNWSLTAWVEAIGAVGIGFGHLILLNWVTG